MTSFDELWNYDQPAETETKFRAVLEQWHDDPNTRLELLTQIARTQGLQRRFEEAHRTLDEVEAGLPHSWHRTHARYLLERGRVLNSSGQREASIPYFEKALTGTTQAGEDNLAVDAAHMLGIVAPANQQLDWNLKALAMAEASTDPAARKWHGSLYNNIGWTYHNQGEFDKALDVFQQALIFRQQQGQTGPIQIAHWSVARTLRSLGRVEAALAMQQALLKAHADAGTSDGYVLEELAECLAVLGRNEDAKPYFRRAYEALSQDAWLAANETARLTRLQTLAH